jgi:archaellum component FlaC
MTAALEERVERLEQAVDHLANERVKPLETQVERLDTWAGPGQNETLSANMAEFRKEVSGQLAELRKDFDKFGKVQSAHARTLKTLARDVATLKTDVAELKTDMVEVKGTLSEILDRLPPRREARDQ